MGRGVNKATIVGRLGADPESSVMPSGTAVTEISVATSEFWTNKDTGAKEERVTWHKIKLFNRQAEIASEFLRKSSEVYIEGSIRHESWDDKTTGEKRYSQCIIARDLQLLGGRPDTGDNSKPAARPAGKPAARTAPPVPQPAGVEFEDDIPF